MRIVLTGGGSGGHITPLLAVARELKRLRPDIELIYIGETGGTFAHVIEESGLFKASHYIPAGKFRRYPGSKLSRAADVRTHALNARDAVRVGHGLVKARTLLRTLKPDGVFIKGGFVGVPVGKAAAALGIPYVTHDSDSTPGLANRLVAKQAAKHATGMPAELYPYPKDKTVFTGTPISEEFQPMTPALRAACLKELGLPETASVVAVSGGSQGADSINRAMVAIAPDLLAALPETYILHIAGPAHETAVTHAYADAGAETAGRVIVKGFVPDLHRYYGAADVVVARPGATTFSELAAQCKAVIAIPALLADDHQTKNAAALAKADAVVLLTDESVKRDPGVLLAEVVSLLGDDGRRTELGRNLARMARPDASHALATLLLETFDKAA
jgi:UDP-N-acetylglucosamine--N-acetylmuramyl-(pentapeptide) pyrophosphoryl-undecaprenol N-acetylglucosamine transferase